MVLVIPMIYYSIVIAKKIVGQKIARKVFLKIIERKKFFYIEKVFSKDVCSPVKRLVVMLPAKGCEWAKISGGCTMCGFKKGLEEVRSSQYSGNDIVTLFKIALILSGKDIKEISIFNGGSFLNQKELDSETQIKIFKIFAKTQAQRLSIETRPEFVTKEKIESILKIISPKKLIVFIGLEAVTDSIREININKGFGLKQYERAARILRETGAQLGTYVFLKPIGLDEGTAIEESIKTISYAFKTGSNEVALETAFVQKGTIMANWFIEGKYRPPWLWSTIEVVKRTYSLGFVHIGNFTDEPKPIAVPSNCPNCTEKVLRAIQRYRENHSLAEFQSLTCPCQKEWEEEISKKRPDF